MAVFGVFFGYGSNLTRSTVCKFAARVSPNSTVAKPKAFCATARFWITCGKKEQRKTIAASRNISPVPTIRGRYFIRGVLLYEARRDTEIPKCGVLRISRDMSVVWRCKWRGNAYLRDTQAIYPASAGKLPENQVMKLH